MYNLKAHYQKKEKTNNEQTAMQQTWLTINLGTICNRLSGLLIGKHSK